MTPAAADRSVEAHRLQQARASRSPAINAANELADELSREAAEVDVDDGFPRRSLALLRERGLLRAPSAAELGGEGLGRPDRRLELLELLAHLGRGSLPVGRIYEGHVNALLLIDTYATAELAGRAAADAAAGHLFAVWNTEAADGVRLVDEAHAVVLSGSKTFATAAGFATRALITAHDAAGEHRMLLVPVDATPPRIDRSFWRPLGMRATASYKADFSAVRVGRDAFVGAPGDYYREPMFSAGAVRFSAVQLGGAEAVVDACRAFLRDLGRSDDPYQRARVGEMAMLVAGGRHWLGADASRAREASKCPQAAVAHAHLMRTAIEEVGLRVMQLAERSVGARGLLRPAPFERLHRDLTHYLRQGAPDAAIAAAGAYVLGRNEPSFALWPADDARR